MTLYNISLYLSYMIYVVPPKFVWHIWFTVRFCRYIWGIKNNSHFFLEGGFLFRSIWLIFLSFIDPDIFIDCINPTSDLPLLKHNDSAFFFSRVSRVSAMKVDVKILCLIWCQGSLDLNLPHFLLYFKDYYKSSRAARRQ